MNNIISTFSTLFDSTTFMPHGHCYYWKPGLVWLHVLSDLVIAVSYFMIPLILVYFILKKKTLPFYRVFYMFGLFILCCGTTHVMQIWTLWHPTYWLSGTIKAITALVSIATAIILIPLIPRVMSTTTPEEIVRLNEKLMDEIEKRKETEKKLAHRARELERMNKIMVDRELKMAELKKELENLSSSNPS
ncbi:MAG: hypothetical protein R3A11_08720 [Bdellovibrionota bacterium]